MGEHRRSLSVRIKQPKGRVHMHPVAPTLLDLKPETLKRIGNLRALSGCSVLIASIPVRA
jgi:hypothetical protein